VGTRHWPPFFFGEGAFLPKWPPFLNWHEELFAACVVFFLSFFLSFFFFLSWNLMRSVGPDTLLSCCYDATLSAAYSRRDILKLIALFSPCFKGFSRQTFVVLLLKTRLHFTVFLKQANSRTTWLTQPRRPYSCNPCNPFFLEQASSRTSWLMAFFF